MTMLSNNVAQAPIDMNILIINLILSTAEKGLIQRRSSIDDTMICTFARGFMALNHKVTIVAAEEFRPLGNDPENIEMVYLPSQIKKVFKPSLLPWPKGLTTFLKKNSNNYDMVITSEAFSIASLIASRICPEKLIIWQEMAFHQKKMKKMPSKFWHNVIFKLLMKKPLIVPRSQKAHDFIAEYSTRVSKTIVDHGADAEILYPTETTTDSFVIVSRLVPGKNIDKMIASFSNFISNPAFSHYTLHIVGDGNMAQTIDKQIKDNNLEEKVKMHGFMTHIELASYLRQAKALLVNTSMDLNMVTIPEAIISGTPVVMNTLPTSANFVNDNHLGIAKDNWNENTLSEIVSSYDNYHTACIRMRDNLTNIGCAKKMINIFQHNI